MHGKLGRGEPARGGKYKRQDLEFRMWSLLVAINTESRTLELPLCECPRIPSRNKIKPAIHLPQVKRQQFSGAKSMEQNLKKMTTRTLDLHIMSRSKLAGAT